jgi:hypothetical protein
MHVFFAIFLAFGSFLLAAFAALASRVFLAFSVFSCSFT